MSSLAHKNSLVRRLALVLTVLAGLMLLALPGLVTSCGEEQEVDPKAILSSAAASMREIKGFHFVYEVHQPKDWKPGAGLYIARITGDVNAEGHMQATVDAVWGGVPVSLGFVALGDTHYIQEPISQNWQEVAASSSPVGALNLGAGTVQILERIMEPTYVGEDSKGGKKTYHIKGKLAATEVEAIAGAVNTTNTFPTDIWIGIEDSLVYEVDIAGAATPNEDKDIWRSVTLSNLDVYVEIEAPQ